jgi:exosome complex RNA-binding protein Rrp4
MESVKMIVFTHLESFWNLLELIINCIIIPGCGWIFLKLGLKNKDLVNTTNMHATHLEKVNNNLKNVTKTIKRKLKKLDESNIKAKKFRPIRERKTKE